MNNELCVGPGWRPLVRILDSYSAFHKIDVLQVKEKMGTLRYYYRPSIDTTARASETMDRLVGAAEELSAFTCEDCGAFGSGVSINGWIRTCCQSCSDRLTKPSHGVQS